MIKVKEAGYKTLWIITEGIIGTENQCLGVAEILQKNINVELKVIRIGLRQPWKTLSPWLGLEQSWTFTPPLTAPWPDIVIAAGRKSIAASRYIKKQSGGQCLTVQLQDPKTSPNQFDLVAAPFHDNLQGRNVIVTDGAPNRITGEKLNEAKEKFAATFEPLQGPRIAVLIGGNSRTHTLTPEIMHRLVDQLMSINGTLMVTASRRTGEDNLDYLKQALSGTRHYLWDGNGENPYHGMLAWAEYLIVTNDSVSMLSDAGTTGKPVHVIALEGRSPRFDRFHKHLNDLGVTQPLHIKNGNLDAWTYEPLNDAGHIASEIQRRLG